MSTDQSPDERDDADDTSAGHSPPTITHQAKFAVDEDDDDSDSEVISTAGVATDTTLSDWGADSQPEDDAPETRIDAPRAEQFGVDDRPEMTSREEGEQGTLFPDVSEDQRTLGGDDATGKFLFDPPTESQSDSPVGSQADD